MKKLLISGTFLIVILAVLGLTSCAALPAVLAPGSASGSSLSADDATTIVYSNQQSGIWVGGSGTVTVVPDIANLNLGVHSQQNIVEAAQAEAAAAMNQIMDVLKTNNVAEKDIRTIQFTINPVYNYNSTTRQSEIVGYSVDNIVNVKLRELDNVGSIIDAVTIAGGDLTVINGISFTVDNPEQYYAQARNEAMNDAKAKAQQLADLGGVTLGQPVYISESSSTPYSPPYYEARDSAGSIPTTSISAGEADIIINVQVVYSIG